MPPDEQPRLVVQRRHHPWTVRLAAAGGAVLILTLGWSLYTLGKTQAPEDWRRLQAARERLVDERYRLIEEKRRLEVENRRLDERLVSLRREADIDREAAAELRQSLRQMQEHLSEYKKELAFYRGIVSPEEAKTGVRVHRFELAPTAEDGIYRFTLVLIQATRHDRRLDGRVRLRFEGLHDGESLSLGWPEVALDSASKLVFSFRYFQELDGTFRLPRDFEPTLVEVEIAPKGSNSGMFTDSYDWRQLVGAGN
jgi:hypothetical protein